MLHLIIALDLSHRVYCMAQGGKGQAGMGQEGMDQAGMDQAGNLSNLEGIKD